jgi:hypothetical protein
MFFQLQYDSDQTSPFAFAKPKSCIKCYTRVTFGSTKWIRCDRSIWSNVGATRPVAFCDSGQTAIQTSLFSCVKTVSYNVLASEDKETTCSELPILSLCLLLLNGPQ